MSLLEPLAYRLEQFVYEGICAVARWSDRDGERGVWIDPLASSDEVRPYQPRR